MQSVYFDDSQTMSWVLGINDRNVSYLEILLGSEIFVRGNSISSDKPSFFSDFIDRLIKVAKQRECELSESEIFMEYQLLNCDDSLIKPFSKKDNCINVSSKSVYPKSPKQAEFINLLNLNQICFAVGPAGTGKTFLAIAHALSQLLTGKKQKIVLTRPVVEAGESLGFLPGDLSQKLNPYLKPLYDSMEYLLTPAQIKKLEENGSIEISPLAYMRGRSINKAVIILDEAQNTTKNQMKMFLTRLGESSQAIITGDITQIDLPKKSESGLVHALSILHDIESLSITEFSKNDIIRSRIVKEIISCYDNE
ncbi:PhoH family protein [Bullifex porci]|uniref:PhoH family protein n=1 Tax=Bullifex porci TaxID=2606638 RepID=UPI0023EF891B|nr:PhoH family protein [Bullifex porci]MDD7589658.1 PhoH family protein [Bullifex porci]